MKEAVTVSLWLLRLPVKRRLTLVLGTLAVSLALFWLVLPAIFLGCVLVLPIALAAWLFGWRGGLLCVAGITSFLGAWYGLSFGNAFWTSPWLIPLVIGTVAGLAVALMLGGLRRMTETLLGVQHQMACIKQTYQQEHELNQVKDQVLQTLSHELRTPLTQIQGYLELLETFQSQLDPAMQARFIALAQDGCEELFSLLTAVLDAAPGRGQRSQVQVFSLRHEVQTVLAHVDPRALQEYCLTLDVPESLLVQADACFVRQVMRNLLTNAFKYTPPHTCITVSALPLPAAEEQDMAAGKICVRVSDEGPGIPREQQPLLFQRFVRLPTAIASGQPGTGLGLAICKQLVEAMGGRIWVESTSQTGQGCCFSFTLASAAASRATAKQTPITEQSASVAHAG